MPLKQKSQRVHERGELFGLRAWPAYLAVIEEPATLKEALESVDAGAW